MVRWYKLIMTMLGMKSFCSGLNEKVAVLGKIRYDFWIDNCILLNADFEVDPCDATLAGCEVILLLATGTV